MKWAAMAVAVVAAAATGCTSTKVVQRDGCWVKREERLWQVKEQLGPCSKPAPAWAQDRQTRLVQECVAQADYRWQSQAVAAWQKNQPLPAEQKQEEVLQACMAEASKGFVQENEELQRRLAEVSSERDAVKEALAQDEAHLRDSHDKMAAYLGEAAQKPAGTATATATASGEGKTDSAQSQPTPAMTWVVNPGAPGNAMCGGTNAAKKATTTATSDKDAQGGAVKGGPICPVPAMNEPAKLEPAQKQEPTADATVAAKSEPGAFDQARGVEAPAK